VSGSTSELHLIIDLLDDKQLDVLYNVAVSFVAQADPDFRRRIYFDYIAPEESDEIERAFAEIRRGVCKTYVPDDEVVSFLEDSYPNQTVQFMMNPAGVNVMKGGGASGEKTSVWRIKRKSKNG
jgi:hypothetical protein